MGLGQPESTTGNPWTSRFQLRNFTKNRPILLWAEEGEEWCFVVGLCMLTSARVLETCQQWMYVHHNFVCGQEFRTNRCDTCQCDWWQSFSTRVLSDMSSRRSPPQATIFFIIKCALARAKRSPRGEANSRFTYLAVILRGHEQYSHTEAGNCDGTGT